MIDLDGRTLMPGFIDAHSHLFLTALKQATVNMDPPPAGGIASIEDIKRNLSDALSGRDGSSDQWLVGWGYDNAMLSEGRHPTRDDLDEVSATVPIIVMHFSTHQLVANSKALELSGIGADSVPPEGGVIQRRPDSGDPNGIIEETAMLPVLHALSDSVGSDREDFEEAHLHPQPEVAPDDAIPQLIEAALQTYAAAGFTTVTEFGASPESVALLKGMAEQGRFPVDVMAAVIYLSATADDVANMYSDTYDNRFRVGGGKINLDGGTPGRTAYLRDPYFKQLPGETDYRGYSSITEQDDLNEVVASYFAIDVPIFIHALGDAAVDQAIAALENANNAHPGSDRRTQLIHLQQVQDDQFASLTDLDVTMTFQVAHNFYFADFHAGEILGPERTARLNPAQSALDKGFSVTVHHDSPVHPVDQFLLMWAAVNRVSRSGEVWGPDERISVMDALKASTIEAAYQFHEDDIKGSIEPGKLADLVILDRNPLTVDPMELKDLEVLETIKEGEVIYSAEDG
ncbi:MAG: amidohydrolase [bacterium]|nr:amidohydrolase [bacterium]